MTEIRYAMEDVPRPGAIRILMQAGEWTEEGRALLADERRAKLEQPVAYTDAPPKRDIRPLPMRERRDRCRTATMVRRAAERRERRAAAPKRKPAPRASRANGRGQSWNSRADITLDRIVQGWREHKSVEQMAAEWNCHRSKIGKILAAARKTEAFKALESELRTCQCGRAKWPQFAVCGECQKRNGKLPAGKVGGWNKRQDLSMDLVMEAWSKGEDLMQLSARIVAAYSTVHRFVRAMRRDPHWGPIIQQMHTCGCGRAKWPQSRACGKCTKLSGWARAKGRQLVGGAECAAAPAVASSIEMHSSVEPSAAM